MDKTEGFLKLVTNHLQKSHVAHTSNLEHRNVFIYNVLVVLYTATIIPNTLQVQKDQNYGSKDIGLGDEK